MKILILHPLWGNDTAIVQKLKKDHDVFLCETSEEASGCLDFHGNTFDWILVRLEDKSNRDLSGLAFLQKLKQAPESAEIPTVVLTNSWNDEQCAEHQDSSEGAHAYLREPVEWEGLESILELIFGTDWKKLPSPPKEPLPVALQAQPSHPPSLAEGDLPAFIPTPMTLSEDGIEDIRMKPESNVLRQRPSKPEDATLVTKVTKTKQTTVTQTELSKPITPRPKPMDYQLARGPAMVPGGASQDLDISTVRHYLELREQDVASLSAQLLLAQEQIQNLEQDLRFRKEQEEVLLHHQESADQRLEEQRIEKDAAIARFKAEKQDAQAELDAQKDKVFALEQRVLSSADELSRLKERIKVDIRKIRVREKELENRLEIMKKDSEVLLTARENKIVELKRKVDLLEFNMDLLQEKLNKEKENNAELSARLQKVQEALMVAQNLSLLQDSIPFRGAKRPQALG